MVSGGFEVTQTTCLIYDISTGQDLITFTGFRANTESFTGFRANTESFTGFRANTEYFTGFCANTVSVKYTRKKSGRGSSLLKVVSERKGKGYLENKEQNKRK